MKESNVASMQALQDIWYLDLCASQHFTNNKDLFVVELCPKYLNFTTAEGQILQAKEIGTNAILLSNKFLLKLWDLAYAPNYNSNFISLGQLRDSNIIYVDNSKTMTLMQAGHSIAHTKHNQDLFVLKLAIPNKAMQITRHGQSTYLVSKNRKIRV